MLPDHDPLSGIISTSITITAAVFIVAFIATYYTEETFGKDLDYVEQ